MDAHASLPYLKFAPVEMHIEINIFAPLLVALQDLVKYFLEYNIFCCQQAFREKLSPFILRLFFLGEFYAGNFCSWFDERVVFTSEIGVDWNVTRPGFNEGVCNEGIAHAVELWRMDLRCSCRE